MDNVGGVEEQGYFPTIYTGCNCKFVESGRPHFVVPTYFEKVQVGQPDLLFDERLNCDVKKNVFR